MEVFFVWIKKYSFLHSLAGCTAGSRSRPEAETGTLRYIPTVNVGRLFSHAPRMAQITAAARSWLQWSIVVLSREPGKRRGEIPFPDISHPGGKYRLNFPARRLPRKYRQIHPGQWPSFSMQIVTWHGRSYFLPFSSLLAFLSHRHLFRLWESLFLIKS